MHPIGVNGSCLIAAEKSSYCGMSYSKAMIVKLKVGLILEESKIMCPRLKISFGIIFK